MPDVFAQLPLLLLRKCLETLNILRRGSTTLTLFSISSAARTRWPRLREDLRQLVFQLRLVTGKGDLCRDTLEIRGRQDFNERDAYLVFTVRRDDDSLFCLTVIERGDLLIVY